MKNIIPINSITDEMDKFLERHELLKSTNKETDKRSSLKSLEIGLVKRDVQLLYDESTSGNLSESNAVVGFSVGGWG